MTFRDLLPRRLCLALLLSVGTVVAVNGGCRLQLEPPSSQPKPPPASPVDPQPQPQPGPEPAPPIPGGSVRESEYYSAMARAVLEGEFVDTDQFFAFSKSYREKHGIPPGGPVANREFKDVTSNRLLDTQAARADIAARLDRIAAAKLKEE